MIYENANQFFKNAKYWQQEMLLLRSIVLDCGLEETLKWKQPCFTYNTKNIVLISSFKDYATLAFFKGVLLADDKKLLVSPGVNSQSLKQFRFTNLQQIQELRTTIKAFLFEALELEKAGMKVEKKSMDAYCIPQEFRTRMNVNTSLKKGFEKLTPGRQRAYLMFFDAAIHSATREKRIDKYTDRITKSIGMNDCVCGLSGKMPSCDGSHSALKK